MYSCIRMHPQTHRDLREARDFMRHAYGRPVNLPDISAHANLSPYHFLRVYKQAYGETPHEFLTRLRMVRAKTLLARGSHNVTEACFEVGFSSLVHLQRGLCVMGYSVPYETSNFCSGTVGKEARTARSRAAIQRRFRDAPLPDPSG